MPAGNSFARSLGRAVLNCGVHADHRYTKKYPWLCTLVSGLTVSEAERALRPILRV
jgi:hypothetical protein